MRNLRTYFVWMLLATAAFVALPRTWVHSCIDHAEVITTAGDHDELAHADCPLCDHGPVASFAPTFDWQPLTIALGDNPPADPSLPVLSGAPVSVALRGPPAA